MQDVFEKTNWRRCRGICAAKEGHH